MRPSLLHCVKVTGPNENCDNARELNLLRRHARITTPIYLHLLVISILFMVFTNIVTLEVSIEVLFESNIVAPELSIKVISKSNVS